MAPATIEYVVVRGKHEVGRFTQHVADGVAGEPVEGAAEAPDVVFTVTEPEAEALRSGDLDPSVAFMRGTMKMQGDFAALLRVLPVLSARTR